MPHHKNYCVDIIQFYGHFDLAIWKRRRRRESSNINAITWYEYEFNAWEKNVAEMKYKFKKGKRQVFVASKCINI